MIKVAVYGSLRAGEYNLERFQSMYGAKNIKVVKEKVRIPGYKLYSLGAYPAITPGEGEITIDILSMHEQVFDSIDRMEQGAGYNRETVKVSRHGELPIYVFASKLPEERLVESGDWSEYLSNQK